MPKVMEKSTCAFCATCYCLYVVFNDVVLCESWLFVCMKGEIRLRCATNRWPNFDVSDVVTTLVMVDDVPCFCVCVCVY